MALLSTRTRARSSAAAAVGVVGALVAGMFAAAPAQAEATDPYADRTVYVQNHADAFYITKDGSGEPRLVLHADDFGDLAPEAVVIHAKPSVAGRTAGAGVANLLGIAQGSTYYLLPQTSQPGQIFLGFGYNPVDYPSITVTHMITDFSGPGQLALWQSGDEGPEQWLNTGKDDWSFSSPANHEHLNWGFTATGLYTFEVTSTFTDGGTAKSAGPQRYTFYVGESLPQITAQPSISGEAKTNRPLTADPGTWSPAAEAFAYQWLADGVAVEGATGPEFVPGNAQIGTRISVAVAAIWQNAPEGRVVSAATEPVEESLPEIVTQPTISGTPKVDHTLTAESGTWDPQADGFAYQWLADGTPIAGATSHEFVPTAAEAGKRISVRVGASWASGHDDAAVSSETEPVAALAATSLTANAVRQVYGKTARLSVAVSPAAASGAVSARIGSRTVTGTLRNGRAVLTVPDTALKPGTRSIGLNYSGARGEFAAAAATARVTVAKASPRVRMTAKKSSVKRGTSASFTVRVSGSGVKPGGRVTVKLAGVSKSAKLRNGRATITIKTGKKARTGKKTVRASYAGDAYVARGTAKSIRISVKR
ncbi:choice-of-anchor M domain-containing protein [Leucobacter weissii]|uniref:Choice-of-anchor M domain-containing protein n=1 Tax=Leucobacter weissii TaxID=1983706 RepID=A0A939ML42_9MICO|nr:choice-of-anchor M domain-containing protein [Leucobacter weissii]MBO1902969.1 choice-of-anchor M domain-containing protein [Leucobacter weissii]